MKNSGLLQETADGVVLQVKALAGSRANKIRGVEIERLKVATTAAPEKGKANLAIAEQLAEFFSLPRRDIRLLRGETSPQKAFFLAGARLSDIESDLMRAIKSNT